MLAVASGHGGRVGVVFFQVKGTAPEHVGQLLFFAFVLRFPPLVLVKPLPGLGSAVLRSSSP